MWRLIFLSSARFSNHHAAAAPRIIIARNTSKAIVIIAKMLPRQPQLRSPSGNLSDKSAIIKPISGVNSTEKKNVQPKPILLLAPTNPTNTAKNVSLNNPNIRRVSAII